MQKHESQKGRKYQVYHIDKIGLTRESKIYVKELLSRAKDLFLDYKTGFGGKFGVQKDRVDKSAVKSYEETGEKIGTNYEKTRPDGKIMVQSYGLVTYIPALNSNLY